MDIKYVTIYLYIYKYIYIYTKYIINELNTLLPHNT